MDDIHKRLKQLRKERGVSLNSLAEKMGVDYQQLSRIERGKSKLNINVLMRMAEALDTPISDIVNTNQEAGAAKILPKENKILPLNDSQEILGAILEKIEILIDEMHAPLRPQTKAAIATLIYKQAIKLQKAQLSADEIISFSVELLKSVLNDR